MSSIGLLFSISKTHLVSKYKQTSVAALGVTFGIGMYIIMMSFMTGLNQLVDGLVLNRTPHIQIYNKTEPTEIQPLARHVALGNRNSVIHSIKPKKSQVRIHSAIPIINELRNNERVKGVAPQAICKVFYLAGSNNLNGTISGIDFKEEIRLFKLDEYVVEGNIDNLKNRKNNILLGAGIAKKLSLAVGDRIQVVGTNGAQHSMTICGIFQSGLSEVDNVQSYVNLKMAQQILGVEANHISRIHVKLYDMEEAASLASTIENLFDVEALDIKRANAQFDTGTNIRNLISYGVSITLLIVAGFGIYNILNMLIYEKMNDIAILKATGFTGNDVMLIFIIQAILIGIIGGLLGLLLGYSVSMLIDSIPFNTEALPTIKTYPVNYDPAFYFTGIVFALISTFLAGYLPARKAQKIDPVEIIRGQ